jgi:hypothetical protein
MFNICQVILAVTVTLAFAMSAPIAVEAQSLTERDTKEIADYVLTDAALANYTKAVHNLHPLKGQLQQDCDREDAQDSLNDMVARMDAVPAVQAALKAAGMTAREYILFSFSLFQNGMAVWAIDQSGGEMLPGIKPENVDFYRAHKIDVEKLGELTREMDCDNQ